MKVMVKSGGHWYSSYVEAYCMMLNLTPPEMDRNFNYTTYCYGVLNIRKPKDGELCEVIKTSHNSEMFPNESHSPNHNTTFYLLKMSDGKICLMGDMGVEVIKGFKPNKYIMKHEI
jgi:hypothetical protein